MSFDLEYQKTGDAEWRQHRRYEDYDAADRSYEKYRTLNPRYGWRIVERKVTVFAAYTPTREKTKWLP